MYNFIPHIYNISHIWEIFADKWGDYVYTIAVYIVSNPRYCWSCGETMAPDSELCNECGELQIEKSRVLAAFLNFSFPGAGYWYLGEKIKGVIWGISITTLAYTVYGLVLAVPLWIFGVYSAYKKAQYNFA